MTIQPAPRSASLLPVLLLLAAAVRPTASPAGTGWTGTATSAGETFNGVLLGSDGFAVFVGDGGAIVHRTPDGTRTPVSSGVSADLFDVFVVDRTSAVAAGRGTVLAWDGTTWTTLIDEAQDPILTSVFVTPEQDFAFFDTLDSQFSLRTVIDLSTGEVPPFGSAVSGFDIAWCGQSGDVKTIVRNGSIQNFDNRLMPPPGTETNFGTLYDNSASPLNLVAAWFPPGACLSGPVVPLDAFAIDDIGRFLRFDRTTGWTELPVDGFVPVAHTLTWLAGSGPDNVIAVGFEPALGVGNAAVAWRWSGTLWAEDTTLPPGAPGLADVAFRFTYEDTLFAGGFEAAPAARNDPIPGATAQVLAAGEAGNIFANDGACPGVNYQIGVIKQLLDEPPYEAGQEIRFEVEPNGVTSPTGSQRQRGQVLLLAFARRQGHGSMHATG